MNILILGAGLMQKPAILSAKELGFTVCVIDANDKAVAISYAHKFKKIDLKDKEGILNNILSVIYKSKKPFTAVSAQILSNEKFAMTVTLKVANKSELDDFIKYIKREVPGLDFITRKNIG